MASQVRLVWEGKRTAAEVLTPPALHRIEQYGEAPESAWNRLIHGDNLAAMVALRADLAGKIALIYLDPPFFTGEEWPRKSRTPAFSDDWNDDLGAYLQWLYDRLTLARELLAKDGSLYVHLSWHAVHYVKLLLDEIFGPERFQNEIVWCYREAINSRKRWNRKHDTLLFYSKSAQFTFHCEAVREPYADSHIKKYRLRDEQGPYRLMGRGIVDSPLRSRRDLPPDYEARYPGLTYRHYLGAGTLPVDYWLLDIENQVSPLRTGYPTQKPEALLERILLASSNPGDLVADFCCGSGTTLAVASRLGRRWIGCDSGALAIHTARKRLLEQTDCLPFVVEHIKTSPDRSPTPLGKGRGKREEGRDRIPDPRRPTPNAQAMEGGGGKREKTSLPTPEVAEVCSISPDAVIVEATEKGARLRLSPDAAAQTDMWAIEWLDRLEEEGVPLRAHWWAARTRRCPTLTEECPLCAPEGTIAARVALTDAAGRTTCLTLALSSG